MKYLFDYKKFEKEFRLFEMAFSDKEVKKLDRLTYSKDTKKIVKKIDEYIWLKEINSQSLQYSLKSLDGAYQNFFKFKKGFPKFKSKHKKNSFCVPQFVRLDGNTLFIPKFKDGIKLILNRTFNGTIKQCTISKTPTNEFFVSILVETTHILKVLKHNNNIYQERSKVVIDMKNKD